MERYRYTCTVKLFRKDGTQGYMTISVIADMDLAAMRMAEGMARSQPNLQSVVCTKCVRGSKV